MTPFVTRAELAADLSQLGAAKGDLLMVHAAVSKVGLVMGGPDTIIGALLDAVGPDGTVMAYTDWDAGYEELADADGRIPQRWRDHIPPYDPLTSRAVRDNGILPEFLRTTPGALRSANSGASVAALGSHASWLVADHPIDYGYGPGSPFARLVEAQGKVLMLGAPLDTMTLIQHAEHLARVPNKRIKRMEVPYLAPDGTTVWRLIEEFDTGAALTERLDNRDYFTEIVTTYLASGKGAQGHVGQAASVIVDAADILAHAVRWLEHNG